MKSIASKLMIYLLVLISVTGCARQSAAVWDDTRTASRHMARGLKVLCGVDDESRMVSSREDFEGDGAYCYIDPDSLDFVPLMVREEDNLVAISDQFSPQPKREPGDGGRIPGIEQFRDPSTVHGMAEVFHRIKFPYDSSLLRGDENMRTIRGIANYMKSNKGVYLFVEGHCDERGADAYNLALGSRRANSVRKLLVNEGVSPDRLFTISYGKERPLLNRHDEVAYAENRRAQFKVYESY